MYLETEYERQLSFKRMIRKKILENEALDAKLERIDAHTAKKLGLLEKIQQHSNDFDANLLNLTDTMMVGLKSFNESMNLNRPDPLHQSADGQVRFYPKLNPDPAPIHNIFSSSLRTEACHLPRPMNRFSKPTPNFWTKSQNSDRRLPQTVNFSTRVMMIS
jgi:hypothetical protein